LPRQTVHHAQQRRLAGARFSDNPDHQGSLDGETDAIDSRLPPEALRQIVNVQHPAPTNLEGDLSRKEDTRISDQRSFCDSLRRRRAVRFAFFGETRQRKLDRACTAALDTERPNIAVGPCRAPIAQDGWDDANAKIYGYLAGLVPHRFTVDGPRYPGVSTMPRDPRFDPLFELLGIAPVTAPNRFWQVPHCTGMGFALPATLAAMRGMKAEGGWGVVNTEYCSIHPSSDDTPASYATLWDAGDIGNMAVMTEAVHRHGALAGVELWHGGWRVGLADRQEAAPGARGKARPQHEAHRVAAADHVKFHTVQIGEQVVEQVLERDGIDVDRGRVEPGEHRPLGVGRHERQIPAVVAGAF
jgi:hypothetical protein